jgi:putative redox protein
MQVDYIFYREQKGYFMETVIKVDFPGGLVVNARLDEMLIPTDQAESSGGQGSAPEPFDLFLASIATCAGVGALSFCQARGLPTEELELTMTCRRHETESRYDHITLSLKVPADFSEKHRVSIHRAMNLCSVKRHILKPPEFTLNVK